MGGLEPWEVHPDGDTPINDGVMDEAKIAELEKALIEEAEGCNT